MQIQPDFSRAARRALFGGEPEIPGAGTSAAKGSRRHTRVKITINLDSDVVEYFRDQAAEAGLGYQQLINQVLRQHIRGSQSEQIAREVGEQLLNDPSFIESIVQRIEK
ncbi:MAG: BrnA antitoxin family protein [Bdellovibrionales bacterium]|nr:BrnA antitoxin family protein [Bdellovibrionales bacterium]